MFKKILRNIFSKSIFIYKVYIRLLSIFVKIYNFIIKIDKINVMDHDWKYLIVLDACRYDLFEKVNIFKGDLKKVNSKGSSTIEWLINNFNQYYDDIIYISANPYVSTRTFHGYNATKHFKNIVPLWLTNWDHKLGTVHPKDVVKYAIMYKNKKNKMIIHFMQPHSPYIGHTKITTDNINLEHKDESIQLIWRNILKGDVSVNMIKKAYIDNLLYVMKYVSILIKYLNGKIIITSDHGECFDEYGIFGTHPRGVHVPELIEVPWLILNKL